jgi:hypothetical protein
MGLEPICSWRIDGEVANATALVESRALILRMPFKRTFMISAQTNSGVEGDELRFAAQGSDVALCLGAQLPPNGRRKC